MIQLGRKEIKQLAEVFHENPTPTTTQTDINNNIISLILSIRNKRNPSDKYINRSTEVNANGVSEDAIGGDKNEIKDLDAVQPNEDFDIEDGFDEGLSTIAFYSQSLAFFALVTQSPLIPWEIAISKAREEFDALHNGGWRELESFDNVMWTLGSDEEYDLLKLLFIPRRNTILPIDTTFHNEVTNDCNIVEQDNIESNSFAGIKTLNNENNEGNDEENNNHNSHNWMKFTSPKNLADFFREMVTCRLYAAFLAAKFTGFDMSCVVPPVPSIGVENKSSDVGEQRKEESQLVKINAQTISNTPQNDQSTIPPMSLKDASTPNSPIYLPINKNPSYYGFSVPLFQLNEFFRDSVYFDDDQYFEWYYELYGFKNALYMNGHSFHCAGIDPIYSALSNNNIKLATFFLKKGLKFHFYLPTLLLSVESKKLQALGKPTNLAALATKFGINPIPLNTPNPSQPHSNPNLTFWAYLAEYQRYKALDSGVFRWVFEQCEAAKSILCKNGYNFVSNAFTKYHNQALISFLLNELDLKLGSFDMIIQYEDNNNNTTHTSNLNFVVNNATSGVLNNNHNIVDERPSQSSLTRELIDIVINNGQHFFKIEPSISSVLSKSWFTRHLDDFFDQVDDHVQDNCHTGNELASIVLENAPKVIKMTKNRSQTDNKISSRTNALLRILYNILTSDRWSFKSHVDLFMYLLDWCCRRGQSVRDSEKSQDSSWLVGSMEQLCPIRFNVVLPQLNMAQLKMVNQTGRYTVESMSIFDNERQGASKATRNAAIINGYTGIMLLCLGKIEKFEVPSDKDPMMGFLTAPKNQDGMIPINYFNEDCENKIVQCLIAYIDCYITFEL